MRRRTNSDRYTMTPRSRPTSANAAIARSMSRVSWAADSWTRIRSCPRGTTGKEKATTSTPFSRSACAKRCASFRLAQHHGHDGVFAGQQLETERAHCRAEVARVSPHALAQRGGVGEKVQRAQARLGDDRSKSVGEQIGTRSLAQPFHDFAPAPKHSLQPRRRAPCRAYRSQCPRGPRHRSAPASPGRSHRRPLPRGCRRPSPSRRSARPGRKSPADWLCGRPSRTPRPWRPGDSAPLRPRSSFASRSAMSLLA